MKNKWYSLHRFRRHLWHTTSATFEDYTALLDFIWREIVVVAVVLRGEKPKRLLWSSVDGSNKLSSYNLIVGRGLKSQLKRWGWQKMLMPKVHSQLHIHDYLLTYLLGSVLKRKYTLDYIVESRILNTRSFLV